MGSPTDDIMKVTRTEKELRVNTRAPNVTDRPKHCRRRNVLGMGTVMVVLLQRVQSVHAGVR